ncbi:isopeptide-forming domain-containing fimbrial protein [Bombilactobacillus bombi]|uniref:isopeptide-forming domain-containing fimbrial protein n=1 Tax=Bombilactobacillus bombi TaxID=1303590 RepID=UPI0035E600C7
MKTREKGYFWKNILGLLFVVSGLVILISQMAPKVSALTNVDPSDPKINTNNSLIISKHPEQHRPQIDVNGPSASAIKYAPPGEGNNDGRMIQPNNILASTNGGYSEFQSEYGATTLVWNPHTLKNIDKITITYGVVGQYKGKDVTAKVELTNFVDVATYNPSIQINADWLIISDSLWSGLVYFGNANMIQTFHFFYTDGTPVHFDNTDSSHTYLTYNSMNGANHNNTTHYSEWVAGRNSTNSYVTTSTIEQEGNFDGNNAIGGMKEWDHKYDGKPLPISQDGFEDKLGAPTYTDASVVFEVNSDAPAFLVGTQRFGTDTWLSFSSATIWNNSPEKPVKDVVEDGKSINNKLVVPHEKFEYTITQKVGIMGQDMLTKYRQFEISDPLPKEVTYLDTAYITDDATGQRLDANAGAFTYENGTLTFKFSYNYLKNIMAYEGETYTVHIPVQVKGDVKLSSSLKSIDNDATTIIDNKPKHTNKVTNPIPDGHDTKIRKKIFTGKLDKVTDWQGLFNAKLSDDFNSPNVNTPKTRALTKSSLKPRDATGASSGANGNYDGSDVLVNSKTMADKDDTDDIVFAEQFKFSKVGNFGSVTLMDNLNPALTVKKVTILNDKGKDITLDGRLTTINGNINWLANDPESFRDNYAYMIITVNLTKGYNFINTPIDSQTGNYIIPNTASAIVDDLPFDSNEVHVIVPHDGLAPAPIKSVVDANNFDINHKLVKDGDILYYHVDQQVGTLNVNLLKKYRSFTLSDKLDINLKYQDSYVINKNTGKKVSDTNTTEYDPKTRTVTWNASKEFLENGMKYDGEIYELVIKSEVDTTPSINNTIGGTNINNVDGRISIKNVGQSIINDTPKKTNEVENPVSPRPAPKPKKTVVDKDGKDINHQVVENGDTLYYRVDQTAGTLGKDLVGRYKSFKILDKLDNDLDFVKAYVINKETNEVLSDPSEITLDKSLNLVTWTASDSFLSKMPLKGESYELVIEVKINLKDPTKVKELIENTATSTIDGNPQITNTVENPMKPRPSEKPSKNVVDKDNNDINHKTISNGDTVYYHVDQKAGTLGKDLKNRYKDFVMLDKLDGDLDYVKAYVIDKATNEVLSDPSEITLDKSTNLVTWTASDNFLKKMKLNGETYELIIEAKVNIKDTSKVKDSIKNTATVNIDNNPQVTNEVENPLTPPNAAPVKNVLNNDGKDINHQSVVNGQTIYYHVSKKVGTLGFGLAQRYKSFTISDKLDKNLKFENAYLINAQSKAKVSDPNEITFDKGSNLVTFKASDSFLTSMPLKGETYDLVIQAQVDIQSDDLAKETEIDNVATVTLDNNPETTNQTDNHYKPSKPTDPTKSVVNHDNKDINHEAVSNGDTLYYHIDKKVGTLNDDLAQRYQEFSIVDKLDKNLNFIKAYVINKDNGKTVSVPAEITTSDSVVTWKASDNFLKNMPLKGETYELVIEAKVNVHDQTSPTDSVVIENIASVSLDNNPTNTNAVDNKLNDKGKAPKPTKAVVNKDGKDINNTTVKVGDTLYYHVDQKVGILGKDLSERYKSFTIKDQLDKRLTYSNAYVINKADGKKMSSDSEIEFDKDSNTILFTASPTFLKDMKLNGETYELVIEVKVNKNATVVATANTDSSDLVKSEDNDTNSPNSATDSSKTTKNDSLNAKSVSPIKETSSNTAVSPTIGTANQTNVLPGTTENGTDSNEAGEVQVIKNVATSTIDGNPQDTNEVKNNLIAEPKSKDPQKDTDKQNPQNNNPEDEPSYKKMAQTGTKNLFTILERMIKGIAA